MNNHSIGVRLDRLVLSSDKNSKFLKSVNQTNSLAQLYWGFPSAVKLADATSFLRPLLAMISQDSEQGSEPNAKGASGLNLSPKRFVPELTFQQSLNVMTHSYNE